MKTSGELEAGALLGGKYEIEGVLGRGGMGIVYAAKHLELEQKVAVKCLLPFALFMPDVVERFTREAKAAARIQGEHAARVLDVGRFDDNTPFMVMEYLHGHDLAKELELRGPLPIAEAVHYVLQACEAIAQAHKMQIVHRDLKPGNLFLAVTPGRRPVVKVLDFGISKVAGAGTLTATSATLGTPYYMSPEQLTSSKSVDHRSDLWSLGVILYQLVTGGHAFPGDSPPEIMVKVVQNEPAPPSASRADLPDGLERVILRCMATKPGDRFKNVAELAAALLPFAEPGDQETVAAIARVTGVSAPGPTGPSGVAVPTLPSVQDGAVVPVHGRPVAPASADPPPAPAATNGGVVLPDARGSTGASPSLSVAGRDLAPKRGSWRLPAVGAGSLAAGGLLIFFFARGEPSRSLTPPSGSIGAPPAAAEPRPVPAAETPTVAHPSTPAPDPPVTPAPSASASAPRPAESVEPHRPSQPPRSTPRASAPSSLPPANPFDMRPK